MTEIVTKTLPRRLLTAEFIALMGVLYAMVAFSIDAMLPALPDIAATLSPDAPNLAQLVLTSFILGIGVGTLVVGPLSDTFGRKSIILASGGLYIVGATLAWAANSLEWILAARVIQGLGAAGPRIVSTAIIRDLYAGRQMARIMSFAMLIFTIFGLCDVCVSGDWVADVAPTRNLAPIGTARIRTPRTVGGNARKFST